MSVACVGVADMRRCVIDFLYMGCCSVALGSRCWGFLEAYVKCYWLFCCHRDSADFGEFVLVNGVYSGVLGFQGVFGLSDSWDSGDVILHMF